MTANLLTGLGIDQVFTRTDGVGTRELFADALGSTVALADTAGAVQTSYTYEAFGGTTQSGSANTSSYKYTGREDDGTGLYYYRARYYNTRLQRFISEDPIGFAGRDVNLYRYVVNNPVNWIDPWGLEFYGPVGSPFYFGRTGSAIEPGGPVGSFLETRVAHMYETAKFHDRCVDTLRGIGVPDLLANYPTMLPAYVAATIYNNLTDYSPPQPTTYPTFFQVNW